MTKYNSFVDMYHDLQESHLKTMREGNRNLLKENGLQIVSPKTNFSTPQCYSCKDEIEFSEGDVIYGDKWYHNACWQNTEKTKEFISH
ncbi:MAG: hypothetical protein ACREBI_12080 [Nitrosotalea sp.]